MTPEDDVFEIIRQEWRRSAHELADWAMERLVNRKDVWGQYSTLTEKEKLNSNKAYKALTLPQRSMRGSDMVTLEKLNRHFRSTGVRHLIGLHAAHPNNTAKWLALDIDLHDPGAVDAEDEARRNFAAAVAWWEELQAMGYDPLLLDSNGAGGYHILTLFENPAPLSGTHALGQHLLASWKQKNVDGPPEQFPKSPELTGDKLGAWLRVFGLHHTRPHFTKVWSGEPWLDEPWLEGSAAIDAILQVQPGPPPAQAQPEIEAFGEQPAETTSPRKRRFEATRTKKPAVCVDLDGVLARYDGWEGKEAIGAPLSGALEFLRSLKDFAEIIVYSSRVTDEVSLKAVEEWLRSHRLPYDRVHPGTGKPKALAYVDDRSVACRPQHLGVAAFRGAEQRIRQLCQERDPDIEATPAGQLGRLVAAWDTLQPDQRDALLAILDESPPPP